MADAIKAKTGVEAELIKGGGGIFDVVVDGELIFSKDKAGRFPTNEEVVSQLAAG